MNRCLSERALLRLSSRAGTAAEQAHLRLCADCAERYDAFLEDLAVIGAALQAPLPAQELRAVGRRRWLWLPAAAASAAAIVVVSIAVWLHQPSPVQVAARPSSLSAFATDLSAALFAPNGVNTMPQLASDAPYLEAALDAGQACTRDRFLAGQCSDELSAFLIEDE